MPHSQRSQRLTEALRRQRSALGLRVEAQARSAWPSIQELDATDWANRMAAVVSRAQIASVRLSAGFLGAYLRSETGSRGTAPVIDSSVYAGVSRDGRPLAEAFASPVIAVRSALKNGRTPDEALRLGLVKGTRYTRFETVQAGRDALIDAVKADDRFSDFQRAVSGTCAACLALSGVGGPHFEVHPGCECEPQPVVRGVKDIFPLPTGVELFRRKSKAEQVAAVGEQAAQLIRDGEADLRDFVSHSKTDSDQPNWITQRPAEDVPATN